MTQQFDFLSRSIDLFRMLSSDLMTDSKDLVITQLDSAQEYLARHSQQLRDTLADLHSLQGPGQSSIVAEASLRNTLEMTRGIVATDDEIQMRTLHLIQKNATKTQQMLHDAQGVFMAAIPAASGRKPRASKPDPETVHQRMAY